MSTASEREAALRRALWSAAEQIEPAPGGFERIQQRLGRPRPVLIAQGEAAWTAVLMRAPDVIEALRRRAANVLRLVWDRFGPKSAQGSGPPWLRWFRPLVAMSVAAFVVGAGVYVGLASPAMFSTTGGGVTSGTLGDNGSHPGGAGRGGQGTIDGTATQSPYPGAAGSSPSSSACSKSPTARFHAPTSSSSTSTSPAPTTTTPGTSSSPPPSGSPSPNPSDSTSPSGGDSGAAPDAGVASGNPAGASDGTSQSTTDSSQRGDGAAQSAPSPATTGTSGPSSSSKKYTPCQKKKTHKTASPATTSAKLTQTQPGRAFPAKLD